MTRKMRPMIVLKLPPIDGQLRRVADVVVDDDEGERADPRAFDPAEAADHGDDEQLDRRFQADVARCDLPVPPDVEHPGQRRR